MEFFQFSFDCLSVGDLITLIFIYEMVSFIFVQTSNFVLTMLMTSPKYRKFIKKHII